MKLPRLNLYKQARPSPLMAHINLIGERHTLADKNLLELGLLGLIEKKQAIGAITFELESDLQDYLSDYRTPPDITDPAFSFILDFAKHREIPLYAIDNRDFETYREEMSLMYHIINQGHASFEDLQQFRELSYSTLQERDTFAAQRMKEILPGLEGTLVHICGLTHLRGLRSRLKQDHHKVTVHDIIPPQQVQYVDGDCLYALTDVIAHGVAEGEIEDMGTGIAKEINRRWPESFKRFKKIRRSRSFKLGDVIIDTENVPAIAYLATQEDLYRAQQPAVNKSLRTLDKELKKHLYFSCSLPKLGCGYGKLEWHHIKPIIDERLGGSTIQYNVYETFEKDAVKKEEEN